MRVAFLIGWILMLFAIAGNIQAGWLYVMVAVFAVVLFISLVVPVWCLRGLTVEVRLPAHAGRGVPTRVSWRVDNPNRAPRYQVLLMPQQDGAWDPEGYGAVSIPARGGRTFRGRVCPPRRGVYAVREAHLLSGAPFGFRIARKKIALDVDILVHPAIPPTASDYSNRVLQGRERGDARRTPFSDPNLYSIREYRPGDSIRRVHWKLSAKRGELMVLEEERKAAGDFLLLIDDRQASYGQGEADEAFETLLEEAIGAARGLLFDLKSEVTLQGFVEPALTLEDETDWEKALRWFALIGLKKDAAALGDESVEREREDRKARLVVFSPKETF